MGPTVCMTWRAGRRPAPVMTTSPVGSPPGGCVRRISRHSSSIEGPPAGWMAPSTPPPPSSVELAALTTASTASRVMSPTPTRTRPSRKIVLVCSGNKDRAPPAEKDPRRGRRRQGANAGEGEKPSKNALNCLYRGSAGLNNALSNFLLGLFVFFGRFTLFALFGPARLDPNLVEHVVTLEGVGDAFGFALGERVARVETVELEDAVFEHLQTELPERDAGHNHHLVEIVNAEAAGLLDPILYKRVAQRMLRLRDRKVRAFQHEAVFAGVLSLHDVSRSGGAGSEGRSDAPTAEHFNTAGHASPKFFQGKKERAPPEVSHSTRRPSSVWLRLVLVSPGTLLVEGIRQTG